MKLLLALSIVVFVLASPTTTKASSCSNVQQDLLRLPIDNLDVKAVNINLLLASFSAQTKIPVGLEVSSNDDLSVLKSMHLVIKHGTLEDVLESIVKQNPLYEWKIADNVVNIVPTETNRDPLLKEVMETKLDNFSVTRGMRRFTFRQALGSTQALKRVLIHHNVINVNQTFMSRDFDPLGRNYSLEASNVSIYTLLNRVIRESETKYWIVMRYGEQKQYFVLNL